MLNVRLWDEFGGEWIDETISLRSTETNPKVINVAVAEKFEENLSYWKVESSSWNKKGELKIRIRTSRGDRGKIIVSY